ncbi:MAG TPA: CHAD domain-containing protein [Bryobacteraceae bacterium]|nr:CHAD domain-containing protein [Bryobacteraceae bacterium]
MMITNETGTFASEQAGGLLRRFAYQTGRTAKSPRAGEVHDLRVAIRRFTQALAAFDSCFSVQEVKKIKRRLKRTMRLAGDVRDYDIAIEMLSRFKSAPAAILTSFRKRRKEAERDLTAALRHWVERRTYSRWRAALESRGRGVNHDPIATTAKRAIEPMLEEFASRGKRALGPKASVEKIHRLRIEAKKVRYTLELFAPVYGAPFDGWMERLKSLQNVLGVISDCEAVREMIERQGGDRRIESALRRKVSRKLGEFRQLWADSFARAPIDIGAGVARKPEATSEPRALRLAAG